jgi:FKBP-type peptidyl-prolyl cis-trans isomerase (trigger factor)
MSVVEAVERDLDDIRLRDPGLADSTLAALALALAGEIDAEGNSATSKSMNAHQLRDTIVKLRELAPPEKVKDEIDELRRQRAERRSKAEGRSQAAP